MSNDTLIKPIKKNDTLINYLSLHDLSRKQFIKRLLLPNDVKHQPTIYIYFFKTTDVGSLAR